MGVIAGELPNGRRQWGIVRVCGVLAAAIIIWAGLSFSADARPKPASIVIDGHSGRVLHASRADELRFPASLTKIMTLYVLFEELAAKRITLKTKFTVSAHSASRPPSRLGLKPGQRITVRNAILALVTKSANDVAATIAENISGTEAKFARRMTDTARMIGMKRTTFRNASGLPDARQVTTARDMARLAVSVQKRFPSYYRYFKVRSFRFRGRRYSNHNRLLGRYAGTDGIKTGYTRASGFNLTSSVRRGNKHIIGVVFGGRSSRARNRTMRRLLDKGFPAAVARKTQRAVKVATARPKKIQARILPTPAKPRVVVASALPSPIAPPKQSGATNIKPFAVRPLPGPAIQITPASTSLPPAQPTVPPAAKPVILAATVPDTAAPQPLDQDTWSIQVGAYATEQAAFERLNFARTKRVAALTGKRRVAVPATVNGRSFFRARFAGFGNRNTAQRACRKLKRYSVRCYAIAPNS